MALCLGMTALFPNVVEAQTPCENGFAGIYPCEHVDLLAHMTLDEIGAGSNTNDIWGWKSSVTGKEYALVGCFTGTSIVDISNPLQPVYLGSLPTHTTNNLWRDLETYHDYLFVVSEAGGHGLQVMNLHILDTLTVFPVTFQESAYYNGFGHCHTLNINQQSGFLYALGSDTFSGGPHIVDIHDPLNPTLAGGYDVQGYTHDAYALNYFGPDQDYQGSEILVCCNGDELSIVNVTDKSDCQLIHSSTYPQLGYVHQGWFTKDLRFFLEDDETDEGQQNSNTRTHRWDFVDLDNPVYLGYQLWNSTAIDHNLYIKEQFVYASNYRSGLRIYDAIDVAAPNLTEIGYFDLYPQNDFAQYSGTWSNYPFLPSRVNIITSMYDGFFILRPHLAEIESDHYTTCDNSQVQINLQIDADLQFPLTPATNLSQVGIAIVGGATTIDAPGNYNFELSGFNALGAGSFAAEIQLTRPNGTHYDFPFTLDILPTVLPAAQNLLPTNQLVIVLTDYVLVDLVWNHVAGAQQYEIQVSETSDFNSLLVSQTVTDTVFNFSPPITGIFYYWRVRPINDCAEGNFSNATSFEPYDLSVDELQDHGVRVFPNPASEMVNLKFDYPVFAPVKVYNMQGALVYQHQLSGSQMVLPCSEWSEGLYIISCEQRKVLFVRKK